METSVNGRALHYVFKIGNRKANYDFFVTVLGMKILRHEEFEKGCEAACNGPYDGKWSKTMVGYGPEDDHFVVELTYNYTVRDYKMGNDFKGLTICDDEILQRVSASGYSQLEKRKDGSGFDLVSPDGYRFTCKSSSSSTSQTATTAGPLKLCSLSVTDVDKSVEYWKDFLQMKLVSKSDQDAVLSYGEGSQCAVQLSKLNGTLDRAQAYGRIAFSVPENMVQDMESKSKEKGYTVLVPFVSLDTPGKATVRVVILADPDGHEICFVGDEGFRDLSRVQPDAESCILSAIEADKSDEWMAKRKAKGLPTS